MEAPSEGPIRRGEDDIVGVGGDLENGVGVPIAHGAGRRSIGGKGRVTGMNLLRT